MAPIGGTIEIARMDALTDQIRVKMDYEKRNTLCSEAQKILADDSPYLPMWFGDAVSVHRKKELGDLPLSPSGDLDFLAKVRMQSRGQGQGGGRQLK